MIPVHPAHQYTPHNWTDSRELADLFVDIQFPEDLGCVKEMRIVHNPLKLGQHWKYERSPTLAETRSRYGDILLDVKCYQRQIKKKRYPVSIDEEKECQESMHRSFWYNICIETVAKIDRVDIVTIQAVSKVLMTSLISVFIHATC